MELFSIAIDGPAGAGKSTIAKRLAESLRCIYIDTGAMYRSIGYYCIQQGIDYNQEEAVQSVLPTIEIAWKHTDKGQSICLNQQDVSEQIRTSEAAAAASKVATYGCVREKLVSLQQEMAKAQSVVMDGRDIGTVVLPFATLKIFLTASVEERAQRRYKEYVDKGISCVLDTLKEEIKQRDTQDTEREISPLRKAEDAIELDTTHMTIDEIIITIKQQLMACL